MSGWAGTGVGAATGVNIASAGGVSMPASASGAMPMVGSPSGATTRAFGAVTGPGAGGTIVTTPTLAAGNYRLFLLAYLSGTTTSADADNIRLIINLVNDVTLPLSQAFLGFGTQMELEEVNLSASARFTIAAIAAGGVAAVYHALLCATPIFT